MRILTTATLVLAGLLGACNDDASSTPSDGDPPLEERPGQLDQSTGKSHGEPPRACPAIALAKDGKCEPHHQAAPCPLVDPDCPAEQPPVACTKIWKPADGRCDLSDPCAKLQDEDCQGAGTPGCAPGGVACTLIRYADNGVCEAAKGCETNDPVDCADPGGVACIEIAYETNGKCEAARGCEYTDPVDCAPVACIAIAYETNGKCEAAKGCEQNDPVDCAKDGGVACIEIRYADNGKCEAARGCEYTDPVDCRQAQCLVAVPSDGKCPRPRDPCDPDCR